MLARNPPPLDGFSGVVSAYIEPHPGGSIDVIHTTAQGPTVLTLGTSLLHCGVSPGKGDV
jgi:hypothetical protein